MHGWVDGWVIAWVGGWMDDCMGGWMDGWESCEERSDISRKSRFSEGEDQEVVVKLELTWE